MARNDDDWLGLRGKVCAITGAGGGIGRALATSFATAGAEVVLLDRKAEDLEQTAAEVQRLTAKKAHIIVCDVADAARVNAAAADALKAAGACDILVNGAALLRPGKLDQLSLAEWNRLLEVNLTGYLLCAQAFGQQMLAKKSGAIVHIASIAGTEPQAASGAYSVSKAGVLMLSKQLAVEWGPSGVRSNVVSPGLVETPMSRAFYATPGVRERRSAIVPARRIAQPQDIADVVLFLASDRAAYVNGSEILVDGRFGQMLMSLVPRPGYE